MIEVLITFYIPWRSSKGTGLDWAQAQVSMVSAQPTSQPAFWNDSIITLTLFPALDPIL